MTTAMAQGSTGVRRGWSAPAAVIVFVVIAHAVLDLPGHPDAVTSMAFLPLPLEIPLAALVLLLAPKPVTRLLCVVFSLCIAVILLLKIADIGTQAAFQRVFNPYLDLKMLRDGWDLLARSAGRPLILVAALALLLAVARRVIGHDAGVRAGQWQAALRGPMFELAGKTALIVGAGRIGRATAQRLRAFDMRVLAYDPFLPADAALPQGIEIRTDLAAALAEADVVSLHLPLTDATRGLIDPLALKRGAIVVNTARGGLLDPTRLLAALESGHLTGAGLDVFDPEPPGAADALLRRPEVVLSPHAASLTDASIERMATECATNIIDFFEGRPPRDSIVNLAGIAL